MNRVSAIAIVWILATAGLMLLDFWHVRRRRQRIIAEARRRQEALKIRPYH